MDTNKHKFFMLQLLKDIFSDALLSSVLTMFRAFPSFS